MLPKGNWFLAQNNINFPMFLSLNAEFQLQGIQNIIGLKKKLSQSIFDPNQLWKELDWDRTGRIRWPILSHPSKSMLRDGEYASSNHTITIYLESILKV